MFSKKIRLEPKGKIVSVATALVLLAIDELMELDTNELKEVYGYQIMTHLRDAYNWNVKSGTVYPILKKLDQDGLIRKGIRPEQDQENKRQMIFYRLTLRGQKVVEQIKAMNADSIDQALDSAESDDHRESRGKRVVSVFPETNFTEEYLSPYLLEFDKKIVKLINQNDHLNQLEEIEKEIHKSILQLDNCKSLLSQEIDRINTLKKIKNQRP